MAYIGDGVICFLIIFNTIGIIAIFAIGFNIKENTNNNNIPIKNKTRSLDEIFKINLYQNNLRGSKIKKKIQYDLNIYKNNSIFNQDLYNKDEIEIYKKIKRNNFSNPKILRKLYSANFNIKNALILVLNCVFSYFCIILMISFCINENGNEGNKEITTKYNLNNSHSRSDNNNSNKSKSNDSAAIDCKGSGGGGGDAAGLVICLLIIVLVIIFIILIAFLTYGLTKGIGKHACRYFSLIIIIVIQLAICAVCFFLYKEEIFYIIGGISSFLAIMNFLGILLPNLNCCQRLTYGYNGKLITNNNIMFQSNNDKNILLEEKTTSTPMDIGNEIYCEKKDFEEPITKPINDLSSQSPRYSDLSNAPLPMENDLPTENEIYNNNTNCL